MRGVDEEILKELIEKATLDGNDLLTTVYTQLLNRYCQELQEPWMTLEEFLKSGFEGLCWVQYANKKVTSLNYFNGRFLSTNTGHQVISNIIKVQPIHKPEPPQDD